MSFTWRIYVFIGYNIIFFDIDNLCYVSTFYDDHIYISFIRIRTCTFIDKYGEKNELSE